MKRASAVRLGILLVVLAGVFWAYQSGTIEFYRLLQHDGEWILNRVQGEESVKGPTAVLQRLREERLEGMFLQFLKSHPRHAHAMVAYGNFLYATRREDEALRQWNKAIAADAKCAVAFNNLGRHYSENGHAGPALQFFRRAIDLEPKRAIYRFNWATTSSLFRDEASQIYGWDTAEVLRRSLVEYRAARDLAPQDISYARAYAEAFYYLQPPDWPGAFAAWKFCLNLPMEERQREIVCCNLARICLRQQRYDEAKLWSAKITLNDYVPLRRALDLKIAKLASAAVP